MPACFSVDSDRLFKKAAKMRHLDRVARHKSACSPGALLKKHNLHSQSVSDSWLHKIKLAIRDNKCGYQLAFFFSFNPVSSSPGMFT